MKIGSITAMVLCSAVVLTRAAEFEPTTFSFASLVEGSSETIQKVKDALTTEGIASVSSIPAFDSLRKMALHAAHKCSEVASALASTTTTFADGTKRRTLGMALHGLNIDGIAGTSACTTEDVNNIQEFRRMVSQVSALFMQRMDDAFLSELQGVPLFYDFKEEGRTYEGFESFLKEGAHLEHFHSYSKTNNKDQEAAIAEDKMKTTIEYHVDQGLMVAFTPAVSFASLVDEMATRPSGKFYIELPSGEQQQVTFSSDMNVLVFMVGDGVQQYVNSKLTGTPLRPVPHSMTMDNAHADIADAYPAYRTWYGRMFLPPPSALDEAAGISFLEVREKSIQSLEASEDGFGTVSQLDMGCSRKLLQSDSSEETVCEENQIFCWMRCMDYTDDASPDVCAAQNMGFNCTSQRDQIWRESDSHGDYNPLCTNSTEWVTDPPQIPDRDADECDSDAWSSYLAENTYDNSWELQANSFYFRWNVDGDSINGELIFNGIAGWLAIGIVNPGGKHNGMCGGHVIMGINDPDPDIYGAPYVGTGVGGYTIDSDLTAFRHWYETDTSVTNGEIEISDCFTRMSFTASSINGWSLNVTSGGADMMWAVHTDSYLKGYHGWMNRGKGSIDFANYEDADEEEENYDSTGSMFQVGLSSFAAWVLLAVWLSKESY